MLTRHDGFTFTWMFTNTPAGAEPTIFNPSDQSTYLEFDSNGLYELTVQIDTLCGTYYAEDLTFTIFDCCGNGVIDNNELCDIATTNNGCCDPVYCVYAPEGTRCLGDVTDQCTHQLACTSTGQCVSADNAPYTLTPLQTQNVQDNQCALDIRTFTLRTQLDDSSDSTPGDYQWSVEIINNNDIDEGYPLYRTILGASQGTVQGPITEIAYSVKMLGGGSAITRLTVIDPCGLKEFIDYNITRNCCGNGILNTNEACDTSGDAYCSNDCTQVNGWCGDAIVQDNEVCDYKINACCSQTCTSVLSPGTLCRGSRGDCDVPEYCGGGPDCPQDVFKPSNYTCRIPLGDCDGPETCSGFDPHCPNTNTPFPAGTLCRMPTGVCMNPGYCDGTSYGCPVVSYRTDVCRTSSSACDPEELCVLGNPNCPEDLLASAGTNCLLQPTACSSTGTCNGEDNICDIDILQTCILSRDVQDNDDDNEETDDESITYYFDDENSTQFLSSPDELYARDVGVCDSWHCTSESLCVLGVEDGDACTIQGVCYPDGSVDPGNSCRYCNASMNVFDWTLFVDDTPCHTLSPEGDCSGQDYCSAGVCIDAYLEEGTICRELQGSCDKREFCGGSSDYCPQDTFLTSDTICRNPSGDCDSPETCSGSSPFCPEDRVLPNTTMCRPPEGPCDLPETCDGVTKNCPINVFKTSRIMCRSPRGECDRPEYCSGDDALCPEDGHYGPEMICREPKGQCDQEERCTGFGVSCPPDIYAPATFICRHPNGKCDNPEYCTGSSIYCPFDALKPRGEVCRLSKGGCDPQETCSGSSPRCPGDVLHSAGTICYHAIGECDKTQYCNGTSFACPAVSFRGPSFICRAKKGGCDAPEYCNLGTPYCPEDSYLPQNTTCRDSKGKCDEVEVCPGDSPLCPADLKKEAGTVCRNSTGDCDRPEVCSGVDDFCPENGLEPSTKMCRPPVNRCDLPEYCPGNHPNCPEDRFASTNTICLDSQGTCNPPTYCSANGTCPSNGRFYDDNYLCHEARSQCDYNAYCSGEDAACPYFPEDITGQSCQVSGLLCRQDTCGSDGTCVDGPIDTCQCALNSDCGVTDSACLVGYCANFYCQKTIKPNTCFIDGICLSNGESNPYNLCQYCDVSYSPYLWASRPRGTHCNTGNLEGDCSIQDTCNAEGVCIDRYDVGRTCRAKIGDCDSKEVCVEGNDWCPEDEFKPSSHLCRASTNDCDAPEYCSSYSPYCPNDEFYPSTHVCRLPRGDCDHAEKCSGYSADCPRDILKPEGFVCRELQNECDLEDVCDGKSVNCPQDKVRPQGWICRSPRDKCDRPEICNGVTNACPADELYPEGTICRFPVDGCDLEERCDGESEVCPPDEYAEEGTLCRLTEDECDVSEFCPGGSPFCPPDSVRPQGTICRTIKGSCDKPEVCDGRGTACPPDEYYGSDHVCRSAKNKCDIEDFCSGNDVTCPFNNVRPDGYPCPDGNFCNGDEKCSAGLCQPAAFLRNCSRPRACLFDSCDEMAEICVHARYPNVGQPCYTGPDGTLDVGICRSGFYACGEDGSLVCNGEKTPKLFDYCGNGKDDDCNGSVDDACFTGVCTLDEQCFNSPIDTCHVGHCEEATGKCNYTLAVNYCFIDGRCYAFDEYKRHNPCQRCYPNISATKWTETNQANASDSNICNGGEQCVNGKVHVDPPPLHCHKLNRPCAKGVCDPASGCYMELFPDGASCHIPGSTCSVNFTCQGGMCICDGEQQLSDTENGKIVVITIAATIGVPAVIVAVMLLNARYNQNPEDYEEPKSRRIGKRKGRKSKTKKRRVVPKRS